MRGIGIHITKLSPPGHSATLPSVAAANGAHHPRQVTLSPVVKKTDARPPALQKLPKREGGDVKREAEAEAAAEGELVLPPVDEVDADVYEALPPEIQAEMELSYQRTTKREQELAEAPTKPEKKVPREWALLW